MKTLHPFNKRHRLLLRWGGGCLAGTLFVAAIVLVVSRPSREAVQAAGADVDGLTSILARDRVGNAGTPIRLEDVTADVGVAFHHFPFTRKSVLPEDMGSGVACGDYDSDGFTDLFFVNSTGLAGSITGASSAPQESITGETPVPQTPAPQGPAPQFAAGAKLYRNIDGKRFEDVTERCGVGFVGCGMGAAWGDYDSDGDLDLYVTAYGANVLYENRGDGTFEDVTERCGIQDTRFGAGCSWADYDRDGDLDLYVCNYVDFVFRESDRGVVQRQYAAEQPYTLNPSSYAPPPNSLFRNRGDGTFEEVAAAVGVADPKGRSLSASWVDMDNDGWVDLYVANDVSINGVFRNRGDGTFEDIGPSSLAADYRGAMGLAVADFDHDLDQDLFVTHWIAQENGLYRNMALDTELGSSDVSGVWFMDDAEGCGLGQVSLDMVGWATGFCDFDNDGLLDLWLINGSTFEDTADHRLLKPQPSFLFWNRGEKGYVNVAVEASPGLAARSVGRGAARLDFDRDGRADLVLLVHGGDAVVLRNTSAPTGNWLRVHLRQTAGNTRALGARVYVTSGGHTQMAEVGSSSSYLSQDELALHFGLGEETAVDELRIVWPDGKEESHRNVVGNEELEYVHAAEYQVDMTARPG